MSYTAAGFMVVLVVHDLRARGPGKRPQSSQANWQAGWRQTTSELAGRHKTRYTENHRIPKITGLELAGRLANDLRAREPDAKRDKENQRYERY